MGNNMDTVGTISRTVDLKYFAAVGTILIAWRIGDQGQAELDLGKHHDQIALGATGAGNRKIIS